MIAHHAEHTVFGLDAAKSLFVAFQLRGFVIHDVAGEHHHVAFLVVDQLGDGVHIGAVAIIERANVEVREMKDAVAIERGG